MSPKAFGLTQVLAAIGVLASLPASAAEPPRFAEIFSDHAVLQRDVPLPVWGAAEPGAEVAVAFAGQSLKTRADAKGRWRLELAPLKAGGPYQLAVSDAAGKGATLTDILVGDVWLCSGQSNMELTTGTASNAWNEVHASANPNLRFVNIAKDAQAKAQDRLKAPVEWKVASAETTGASSAVCYYMSKALQAAEKAPIGFINSSWGGTPIQAWIPEPTLRRLKTYDAGLDQLDAHAGAPAAPTPTPTPGAPWEAYSGLSILYNGMIAPLAAYRLKGAAWYQGESNWKDADQYQGLLETMIGDWRRTFGDEKLPFLVVQLPDYGAPVSKPGDSPWPHLREAERRAVLQTPHTGLAVTIDVGDRFDLHPGEKAMVGQRLALAARRVAYGEAVPASPTPLRIERRGSDLAVVFKDAEGLKTYSSDQAIGFEACDAARACRFVEGVPDKDAVVLKGANRPEVRFVRYAWADAPFVNLFNAADLPAAPFEMPLP